MYWIVISGSWRYQISKLERDVKACVTKIIKSGNGIVTGGALGVDFIATNTVLTLDPKCKSLKIYLPTNLNTYTQHYLKRAKEGIITQKQANELLNQLLTVKKANSTAIIENHKESKVWRATYFARNKKIVEHSNELIAFQVNKSAGTQNAIDKARKMGRKVTIFNYTTP